MYLEFDMFIEKIISQLPLRINKFLTPTHNCNEIQTDLIELLNFVDLFLDEEDKRVGRGEVKG